jgi:hypothetical protein
MTSITWIRVWALTSVIAYQNLTPGMNKFPVPVFHDGEAIPETIQR